MYRHIIKDKDEKFVQYLKERSLLLADNSMTCIKAKDEILYNDQPVKCLRSSKNQSPDGIMKKVV